MTLLLVVLGGMVGAPARFLTDKALQSRAPLGTLLVNIAGSFLLGTLTGVAGEWKVLVGTGFCGALTTYSTFSFETLKMLETGRYSRALAYMSLSLMLGIGAAAAGYALT